jgi:hypothetical protein
LEQDSRTDFPKTTHSNNIAWGMMVAELMEIEGIGNPMTAQNPNTVSLDVRPGFL